MSDPASRLAEAVLAGAKVVTCHPAWRHRQLGTLGSAVSVAAARKAPRGAEESVLGSPDATPETLDRQGHRSLRPEPETHPGQVRQ
jgi:hypothetical protein